MDRLVLFGNVALQVIVVRLTNVNSVPARLLRLLGREDYILVGSDALSDVSKLRSIGISFPGHSLVRPLELADSTRRLYDDYDFRTLSGRIWFASLGYRPPFRTGMDLTSYILCGESYKPVRSDKAYLTQQERNHLYAKRFGTPPRDVPWEQTAVPLYDWAPILEDFQRQYLALDGIVPLMVALLVAETEIDASPDDPYGALRRKLDGILGPPVSVRYRSDDEVLVCDLPGYLRDFAKRRMGLQDDTIATYGRIRRRYQRLEGLGGESWRARRRERRSENQRGRRARRRLKRLQS